MNVFRFRATHAVVANAPQIISLAGDASLLAQRIFSNAGAPAAATLVNGNGKYCAVNSGWIIAASLYSGGTGYALGDVLTLLTGTAAPALQLTVDAVTATGVIADFHVSRVGNYTAYPDATAAVTGGTGTGALFMAARQAPDAYLDVSTLTAPVLYICTIAGSSTTSVWARVSGGGGGGNWNYRGLYDPAATLSYMTYDVVQCGTGTSAGMYLSTIDSNNNAPDSGIGWVQVATGSGTWL